MSDRKLKTGANNELEDDLTSLAQCLPGEVSYLSRFFLDETDGAHPADWQREKESERR